jgi:hypothetical protein
MKERNIQVLFGKWLQGTKLPYPAAFELKITKKDSIPFKSVKEHQITALLAVKGDGLYHKITDQPWIVGRPAFTYKKPFDCLWLNGIQGYIGVIFYIPRQSKVLYLIEAETWHEESILSSRKSLTRKRASELASSKVLL